MQPSRFDKPVPLAWGDADKVKDATPVRQIVSGYFMETDETVISETPKHQIPLINPLKSEVIDDGVIEEVENLLDG